MPRLNTRAHYVQACRLMRGAGMQHTQVHRRQQIALVLVRYGHSWNSIKARLLIATYEGTTP